MGCSEFLNREQVTILTILTILTMYIAINSIGEFAAPY